MSPMLKFWKIALLLTAFCCTGILQPTANALRMTIEQYTVNVRVQCPNVFMYSVYIRRASSLRYRVSLYYLRYYEMYFKMAASRRAVAAKSKQKTGVRNASAVEIEQTTRHQDNAAERTTKLPLETDVTKSIADTTSREMRVGPLLCHNNETVTQVALQTSRGQNVNVSTFSCPRSFEPEDHTECCGEVSAQFCCKPIDSKVYTSDSKAAQMFKDTYKKHYYWKYHFFMSRTRFLVSGVLVVVVLILLFGLAMLIRRKRLLMSSANRHIIFSINQSDLKDASNADGVEMKLPDYSECVGGVSGDGKWHKLREEKDVARATTAISSSNPGEDPPKYSQRRGSNASF